MKRYDKYKDSGVAWLGQVPSHWEIAPMKRYASICNGSDYKHILADTGYPVMGSGGQFAFASEYMYDGEVVLLGRKGTIDKPLYFNGKFWTVDTMFYAIPKQELSCKFLFYQALTIPFGYYSTATTIPSMTSNDLSNHPMVFPPLAEQEAIAAYLDEKCEAIDGMVEKIEEKIALFQRLRRAIITRAVTRGLNLDAPLRPSGIDWIGEIPEHWEVCAIKQMAKLYGRIGFRGYTSADLVDEGQGAITLSPSNIVDGKMDYSKCSFLSWDKYYESPEIMIENGDVLFVKTASVGKTAFVENLPLAATLNPQIAVFKNIKGSKKFLSYLLRSSYITALTTVNVGGSTVPTISQQTIGNYIIPLPPLAEQQAIADYLDRKCGKIDELVAKYEQQKELLARYKKALIAQVVTGQRRVCKPVFNYQTAELDNSSISMAAENNI